MKILNDELDKSLKKKNQINLWVIIGSMLLLGVILFLLIFYQSSSRQLLFSILCTIFTVIYLLVIWILIYASMTPIHRYRKVLKIYNSRSPQHLVLRYLSTKEEVENYCVSVGEKDPSIVNMKNPSNLDVAHYIKDNSLIKKMKDQNAIPEEYLKTKNHPTLFGMRPENIHLKGEASLGTNLFKPYNS